MLFLCLGYYDSDRLDALPAPEIDAFMGECLAHLDAFYGTGQVVADIGLDVETTTLRNTGDGVNVASGRLANGALIGCTFVVEAGDMGEAARVASRHPSLKIAAGARFDCAVEIRPIHTFREPGRS